MRSITNVAFDTEERAVFKRARVWRNLTEHERVGILEQLANREPNGMSHAALTSAHEVLSGIVAKATDDREQWLPASQEAPEEAPETSIVTNPRQAALTIVQARDQAIRECTEALFLVETALRFATPAEEKYIGV